MDKQESEQENWVMMRMTSLSASKKCWCEDREKLLGKNSCLKNAFR